jgi:hypothetical protein
MMGVITTVARKGMFTGEVMITVIISTGRTWDAYTMTAGSMAIGNKDITGTIKETAAGIK